MLNIFDDTIIKNVSDENKRSINALIMNTLVKTIFFILNIGVKAFKYRIYNNIYIQSSEALNYSGLGEHT